MDSRNPKGDPLVPAFLLDKEDADPIKQYIQEKNGTVRMKLSFMGFDSPNQSRKL